MISSFRREDMSPPDPVAESTLAAYSRDANANATGSPLQVLVVDDDEVDRLAVRRTLSRLSLNVEMSEATSSTEALDLLQRRTFDCVLLDFDIPGADGLSLLRTISHHGIRSPVVMFTGVGDEQVAVELMKAGAVDYLPKSSLSPERLGSSLRHAVELSRARAAAEYAERELRDSVERSRHLAEMAQSARMRTERLQLFTERLASLMSVQEAAELFVQEVRDALGVSTAAVCVHDAGRSTDELHTVAHIGYDSAIDAWVRFVPQAGTPVHDLMSDCVPQWFTSRLEIFDRYPRLRDEPLMNVQDAMALLPLMIGDRAAGVISLGFGGQRQFSSEDKALALTFARQCAQAIERARLYEAERLARELAVEANRAKSDFLARMSHDLRTPLNAIGGYTQLLELGVHGEVNSAQADALARIRRAQEHLLTLINDILGFARIEAGQVQLELTAVSIDETLQYVMELMEPQSRVRGLTFTYERNEDDSNAVVHADRDRLVQIMLNLLTNAMKFTNAPGAVTLSFRCTEKHVEISVTDTGRGISPARLTSIFDPFVQEGRAPGSEADGVGLGLAISRDLANMMNADLSVESEPDVGSTFTLTLRRA